MLEKLDAFLDAAMRRPWNPGGGPDGWHGHDCLLFPANWMHELTGHDPAEDLRGTYSTEEEAVAILEELGGYFPVMATRFVDAGWRSAEHPQTGDIGLVVLNVQGHRLERGAIRRESRWLIAHQKGLLALPSTVYHRMNWRAP